MNNLVMPHLKRNQLLGLITAIKMGMACLIGFWAIDYYHLPEGVWCVVTIAAVMQVGLQQTLAKSLMRAIGTIVGAIIGFMIALLAKDNPVMVTLAVFFIIFLTSTIALQPTIYSYAGIIMGVTIAIIVSFNFSGQNLFSLSVDRTVEVLLGIAIVGITNIFLFLFVKRYFPGLIHKETLSWQLPTLKVQKKYIAASLKVATACILTFLIWQFFKLPQGYWALITCLVIMEENQQGTLKKGFLRFLSHFIAALIGLISVWALTQCAYYWRLLPLLITFIFCGYLIGSNKKYQSMGNTLGVAMAIMLLSNPDGHDTLSIIFARFYNVVIGIGIAYAMLIFGRKIKSA
jgi:uncharacterized membrane protein YccC